MENGGMSLRAKDVTPNQPLVSDPVPHPLFLSGPLALLLLAVRFSFKIIVVIRIHV